MAEVPGEPAAGLLLGSLRSLGALLQRLPRPAGLVLAAGWLTLIWQLSSLPSGDDPPNFPKAWLANSAHAPLFGLLALWCAVALPREDGWPRLGRRACLGILLFVLAYAGLDELHQAEVPGRDSSLLDLLTDVVGAGCTLWLASYVGRSGASSSGSAARLALGLGLCAAVGLAATLA